jgi:hypothetical protein
MSPPRVAFFADSFSEVNGVAHTFRTLTALAARPESPFFVVYGGEETKFSIDGALTRCQLRRGSASFAVDRDFRYDLLFYRHRHDAAFLRCVIELAQDPTLRARMGLAARRRGMETSWDSVWLEMLSAWGATCARRVKLSA